MLLCYAGADVDRHGTEPLEVFHAPFFSEHSAIVGWKWERYLWNSFRLPRDVNSSCAPPKQGDCDVVDVLVHTGIETGDWILLL